MSEPKPDRLKDWPYWWVTFEGGVASRFVYGKGEEAARAVAVTYGTVCSLKTLPYAAGDNPENAPAFCYRPRECAGRTACPQNYSCTE